MVSYPSVAFWRKLNSPPNPEFEKVISRCAMVSLCAPLILLPLQAAPRRSTRNPGGWLLSGMASRASGFGIVHLRVGAPEGVRSALSDQLTTTTARGDPHNIIRTGSSAVADDRDLRVNAPVSQTRCGKKKSIQPYPRRPPPGSVLSRAFRGQTIERGRPPAPAGTVWFLDSARAARLLSKERRTALQPAKAVANPETRGIEYGDTLKQQRTSSRRKTSLHEHRLSPSLELHNDYSGIHISKMLFGP
jgi:hypothetical protein